MLECPLPLVVRGGFRSCGNKSQYARTELIYRVVVWWEHCGDQSQEALVVRRVIFAVPCAVSCRSRSTFCSAAAMLSAAAALLDPVSHFTLEVLSLSPHTHSLRFGVLGRSNYWPDTPGTTLLYAGSAHHMYIGFPWLPCPCASCSGKRTGRRSISSRRVDTQWVWHHRPRLAYSPSGMSLSESYP